MDIYKIESSQWWNGSEASEAIGTAAELSEAMRNSSPEAYTQIRAKLMPYVAPTCLICNGVFVAYGRNLIGCSDGFMNTNASVLDHAEVRIGNALFMAPSAVITTIGHAVDHDKRAAGWVKAKPVTIGNNVWLCANVTVCPGVTIGDNVVIGAGVTVRSDVPSNTVLLQNN